MRELGFYWVKVTADSEPEVAMLVSGEPERWAVAGLTMEVNAVLSARIMSPAELELMNVVDLVRHLVRTVRAQGIGYDAKGDGFSIHISTQEGAERVAARRKKVIERINKREALARARKEGPR